MFINLFFRVCRRSNAKKLFSDYILKLNPNILPDSVESVWIITNNQTQIESRQNLESID